MRIANFIITVTSKPESPFLFTMTFFERLTKPFNLDLGILLLRLWLGGVMIFHGFPKITSDLTGFAGYLSKLGLPAPDLMARLAAGAEFFGGLLLFIGLLSRPAAVAVLVTMCVAGFIAHAADPFSDKELALSYAVTAVILLITGPMKFSIDAQLARRAK